MRVRTSLKDGVKGSREDLLNSKRVNQIVVLLENVQ
jgi:hypothetical protein